MSLISFLGNHIEDIATGAAMIGGYLFARDKKAKKAELKDKLYAYGRRAMSKLLTDPRLYDDAYVNEQIEKAIWKGLDGLGVKHNKLLDKLVAEAVEALHDELAERVIEYHFKKIIPTLEKTSETLKSAQ